MAKRILNRKELRADYDAAERRHQDDEDETEDVEEEADDEEEEAPAAEEAGEEAAEEEEAPKKRKKPAKPRTRSRSAKATRMRVVWGVFNNSHVCVATYEYPKKKEADEHAAKLTSDKRSTHFVQPVKEAIAEKA